MEPDWLILDEPTLGLDYTHKLNVQALLEKRRGEGRGSLVITHDLDLVLAAAPRLLALRQGRLMWDGPTVDFLLHHDLETEFGLTDPDLVAVWKQLESQFPDWDLPNPLNLESWAQALTPDQKLQLSAVLFPDSPNRLE